MQEKHTEHDNIEIESFIHKRQTFSTSENEFFQMNPMI